MKISKICNKCRKPKFASEIKSESDFAESDRIKCGFKGTCKDCNRKAARKKTNAYKIEMQRFRGSKKAVKTVDPFRKMPENEINIPLNNYFAAVQSNC